MQFVGMFEVKERGQNVKFENCIGRICDYECYRLRSEAIYVRWRDKDCDDDDVHVAASRPSERCRAMV